MPYEVVAVDHLYQSVSVDPAEEVQAYLNRRESEGFELVAVIPDHRTWDDDGDLVDHLGAMLVMHRPAKHRSGGGFGVGVSDTY